MTRAVAVPFLLAVALLSVSACSTSQPGNATPASAGGNPPVTSPSGSAPAQPSVASIDPCAVLKPADLTRFGTFENGEPDTSSGVRSCSWKLHVSQAGDPSYAVSVDVRDSAGINDGPAGQSAEVNGRPAVQSPNLDAGDCTIRLKVSDSTRVDVGITGLNGGQACDVGSKVAYVVEPRLPK